MPNDVLVVLPTLGDRMGTLEEALRSVDESRASASIRLVVVVPPAAEPAIALAKAYGAEIVDDPRRGLAGAMNAGIAARQGERFYVGLGDDDLIRSGAIADLVDRFDRTPGASVVFGACDYIDAESQIIGVNRAGRLASWILSWGPNLIPHPGALISLDALEEVGGFAEDRPYTMDLDAFLKLKRVGKLVSIPRSVSAFRWHADSLTVSGRRRSVREALDVKRSYLPRWAQPLSWIWLIPVAWATAAAAIAVSTRARRMAVRREQASANH